MKIYLIEKQPVAESITSRRDDIEVYDGCLDESVEMIAEDIKNRFAKSDDVLLIDVHLSIGGVPLSENAGIKLLKMLRLHRVDNHVVLYSWLSREMLMDDLSNAIIFSKGVTFCKLPSFLDEIQHLDFSSLCQKKADKDELLQLFRAEYNPDNRHFNANKFGVWQLTRVQMAYESIVSDGKVPSDVFSSEVFDFMKSYEGMLVQYISEWDEVDLIREYISALHDERYAALLNEQQEIKSLEEQIDIWELSLEEQEKQIEEDANRVVISELSELFEKKRLAKSTIEVLEEQKNELEQVLKDYNDVRARCVILDPDSIQRQKMQDVMRRVCELVNAGDKVRKSLAERVPPRIVYVDDMANEGWADMLKRIIYKKEWDYKNMTVIAPNREESIDTIVERILRVNNPDLIILDIRLKDEHGYYAPADLSGFQVLQKLNETNLPCAILVFTASNKVWSLKEAFKGNVMSFWTKGLVGADEIKDCVKNYLDLLRQINYLIQYKWLFELFAKIGKVKDEIEHGSNSYWWEIKQIGFKSAKTDKKPYNRKLTKKEEIVLRLANVLQITRNAMRQMFFFDNSENVKAQMLNSFVMRVFDNIEQIFYYNERNQDFISLLLRMDQNDPDNNEKLQQVLHLRNNSAHYGYLIPKKEDVIKLVDFVLDIIKDFDAIQSPCDSAKVGPAPSVSAPSTQVQFFAPASAPTCVTAPQERHTVADGLTPMAERKSILDKNDGIVVEIINIRPNEKGSGSLCDFYIDEKGTILTALNESDVQLTVGDMVQVKLFGYGRNGTPLYGIIPV